jgi:hypothetical protein
MEVLSHVQPERLPNDSDTAPLLSIIIDNYNYEAFLADAIDSALAQTYPKVEVIVVDDGSTDGSRDVLERYEGRITAILKSNGGQASALNLGFEHSSGDLILFLDSDDMLAPTAADEVVKAWRPSLAKIQYPMRVIDRHGKPMGRLMPRAPLGEGRLDQIMLDAGYYICPPTSGNVWAKPILKQLLPVPELEWPHVDAYLHTLAPFFGEVGVIKEPLAGYRVHGESMSSALSGSEINVQRVQRLLDDSLRQRRLLDRFAAAHNLRVSPHAVTSHWIHLKLELVLVKLTAGAARGVHLWTIAALFVKAVWRGHRELDTRTQIVFTLWAMLVVLVPKSLTQRVVKCAFGYRPGLTIRSKHPHE